MSEQGRWWLLREDAEALLQTARVQLAAIEHELHAAIVERVIAGEDARTAAEDEVRRALAAVDEIDADFKRRFAALAIP